MSGDYELGEKIAFRDGPSDAGIDSLSRVNTSIIALTTAGELYKSITDDEWELISGDIEVCPFKVARLVQSHAWRDVWVAKDNKTLLRHSLPDNPILTEEPAKTTEYTIPDAEGFDFPEHPPNFSAASHNDDLHLFIESNGTILHGEVVEGEIQAQSVEDLCLEETDCLVFGDESVVFSITGQGAAYIFDWAYGGFRDVGWVSTKSKALSAENVGGIPTVAADDGCIYRYAREYHGWIPSALPKGASLASFVPVGPDGVVAGVCVNGDAIYGDGANWNVFSHPTETFTDVYVSPDGDLVFGTESGRMGYAPGFVQWATGWGTLSKKGRLRSRKVCPDCGFVASNPSFEFCPVDRTKLRERER